ncbi:MurR/RpiR family transcriptional regulator [Rhodopila sp.]|uniref:MurR/RpiR family transcriptional regulator n=1 Tax=Rhodopila sp. TaxID=2480087 RepID=UPI003D0AF249
METGIEDLFGQRLAILGDSLSPASRRVARYINANRAAVLASSAMDLAAGAGTSDATVVRTVQALGFAGLGALKQALLASVERPTTLADDMRRTLGDVGENTSRAVELVFEAHEEALAQLRQPDARARIIAAVSALHPASRIAIFGIGPSAALAGYVAMLLSRAGRRSLNLTVTGAMLADQLLDLRAGDALLILAYGRAYREVVAVFAEAKHLDLPIVLVTDSLDPKLARFAKVVLPARRGRAERVALHGATLVCLEALVLGLAAASKSTAVATLERLHRLRGAIRGG